MGIEELAIATGTIIASVASGFLALKVDLAKLKTDVSWIKRELTRIEAEGGK